jgi:DNA ligase-1
MKELPTTRIFKTLKALADTGSITDKERILRNSPWMKPVLKWTYNPYWNYYYRKELTKTHVRPDGANLDEHTFNLLRNLRDRKITGSAAESAILAETNRLSPAAFLIFSYILQRDLRAGINVKIINRAFPGLVPTFDVMLAQKMDWSRLRFPCWSSLKFDGVRGIYRDGKLYTRSGKILTGLDHILKVLDRSEHELDGELIVRGEGFQSGSGRIRSDDDVPDAEFHIFDVPSHKAEFRDRMDYIEAQVQEDNTNAIHRVGHYRVDDPAEIKQHYYKARKMGYEGLVVKPFDYPYEQKRSYSWLKMKDILTADLKVVDIYEGTGKYEGQMGGLVVDFKGKDVRVGGGFSDQQREYFWKHQPIGAIIEVLYQEETDDNSLRHPRFVVVRDDKDEADT